MNPHDICYAHIKDNKFDLEKIYDRTDGEGWQKLLRESVLSNLRIPEGEIGAGGFEPLDYYVKNAPPLPDNYLPQSNEPDIISGNGKKKGMSSDFGRYRGQYDSLDWLLHRFAYVKFVEEIDQEVGELLRGLKESGYGDDTYIIFTSDHGEQNGAHQMAGKGLFYDEACHVPLIVAHPSIDGGRVDDSNLISNGLDLLPTIFELARVASQFDFEGQDLSSLFYDADKRLNREYVPVEFSTGMGLVSSDYYYGIYFNGNINNEQLYDMRKQPLQMVNDALNSEYEDALKTHRNEFKRMNNKTLESFGYHEGFMKFLN
jgi:choline-sulfatase